MHALQRISKDTRVKDLHLFIQKPPLHCETLTTYWSLDPTGSGRLSPSDLATFGLTQDAVETYRTLNGCSFDPDYSPWREDVYRKLGIINAEGNDVAHLLGLPLVQLHGTIDEPMGL